jgi:uncharacterized protein
MLQEQINRREMLKTLLAATAAISAPAALFGQGQPTTQPIARDRYGDLLPQRKLGKTGAWVTMLGLGGSHVGRPSEAEAQKMVETAIAGGVRFFDTAVVYQNGGSEERLGKFLTPKYRDVVFLMTKSMAEDAAAARKDLDDSLRRLKTDYIDLWQMHDHPSAANVDKRIDGGVIEAFMDAKAKGKVKHIGFTGHVTPDAHLRMIDRVAKEKGDVLETCQMPINLADPTYSSFILRVLPALLEHGHGVLAMKTLAGGGFVGLRGSRGPLSNAKQVVPDRVSVADALHFVWSLPVSCLISGPDTAEQFNQTIALARSYSGMTEDRRKELIAKVADAAGTAVEYYKA